MTYLIIGLIVSTRPRGASTRGECLISTSPTGEALCPLTVTSPGHLADIISDVCCLDVATIPCHVDIHTSSLYFLPRCSDRGCGTYYQAETFRGPSLYFHQRALQTRQPASAVTHIEYVYATLASWGMHRMGRGGSKMQRFDTFSRSVDSLKDKIAEAQQFIPQNMSPEKWGVLKEIFHGIKVMASRTSLVGNSKVMHHMMPNIVPPIDREYTLRYLRGNTNISNDLDR